MAVRVDVKGELIAWARERSGIPADTLSKRFKRLEEWERGEFSPTLRQLEDFADATHTPVGFLFLTTPPSEELPIPDLRTIGDRGIARPTPDLLDTVYLCQERQDWYRVYAEETRQGSIAFVGSLTASLSADDAASTIRKALAFDIAERGPNWSEALRRLGERAEGLGILVMSSGIVGSNTHRRLSPREFRGFALVDQLAPLVFVNGADTKAAQIFTLAHEIAHVWLGESAVSDAQPYAAPQNAIERWCNEVAAELLVPLDVLRDEFRRDTRLAEESERLAGMFKVSTLVVLRRVHDAGHLSWTEYRRAYDAELERVLKLVKERRSEGGNFYNTQPVRTSKRFAQAVITSTVEGQTLYADAFHLLGFRKTETFNELARRFGVT